MQLQDYMSIFYYFINILQFNNTDNSTKDIDQAQQPNNFK